MPVFRQDASSGVGREQGVAIYRVGGGDPYGLQHRWGDVNVGHHPRILHPGRDPSWPTGKHGHLDRLGVWDPLVGPPVLGPKVAVVGDEEDEGVVELPRVIQGLHHPVHHVID